MDNVTKSEQEGCSHSLGGGLTTIGIIIVLALWSTLVEYIIAGAVILVLTISLIAKIFGNNQ